MNDLNFILKYLLLKINNLAIIKLITEKQKIHITNIYKHVMWRGAQDYNFPFTSGDTQFFDCLLISPLQSGIFDLACVWDTEGCGHSILMGECT